jgi:hypothetical protein
MEKITNTDELKRYIYLLEVKQVASWHLLQSEIGLLQDKLKPMHLIKNAFSDITSTSASTFKKEILSTAVGLTAGLAVKAIAGGFSHNPIKKLIAAVFQFRVANAVSQESGIINVIAEHLLGYFRKNK